MIYLTVIVLALATIIVPILFVIGTLLFLYFLFGRKACVIGALVMGLGAASFFSYFRIGYDQAIVDRAIAKRDPSICHRLLPKPFFFSLPNSEGLPQEPVLACYNAYSEANPGNW
jgi:hypothetical protein